MVETEFKHYSDGTATDLYGIEFSWAIYDDPWGDCGTITNIVSIGNYVREVDESLQKELLKWRNALKSQETIEILKREYKLLKFFPEITRCARTPNTASSRRQRHYHKWKNNKLKLRRVK